MEFGKIHMKGGHAAKALPMTSKTVEGGPTQDALVGLGLSVRNECEDVVILNMGIVRRVNSSSFTFVSSQFELLIEYEIHQLLQLVLIL